MGLKAPDSAVIPLCAEHHKELHMAGDELAYLGTKGIMDGRLLAADLWECKCDYRKALSIIENAKECPF
jgi:hypothetical protein